MQATFIMPLNNGLLPFETDTLKGSGNETYGFCILDTIDDNTKFARVLITAEEAIIEDLLTKYELIEEIKSE